MDSYQAGRGRDNSEGGYERGAANTAAVEIEEAALLAKGHSAHEGWRSASGWQARNALFLLLGSLVWRLSAPARRAVLGLNRSNRDHSLEPVDIEQQAFIEFCDLLDSWRPAQTPFLPYLATTLPWRLLHYVRRSSHYRSRVRMVSTLSGASEADDAPPTEERLEDASAQGGIVDIESHDAWKYHTDPLDDGLRQTVMLRYGLGLSNREIAGLQGRSRRTIDRELRNAIRQIKRRIEDEWENCS